MTDMSNYLEDALLDHVLGNTAFTQPTNIYALLHVGDPGETGASNLATDTTKSGAITFAAASGGSAASSAAASWTSLATADPDTLSHVSLWDNSGAGATGNCLFKGALSSSVVVNDGDDFTIPSGSLTIAFD